jgi:hypothetical protein
MPRRRSRRIFGGFDCEGEIDFLTQNEIEELYVYKLGKNCFDIRSLVDHIRYEESQGRIPTNPFNRVVISSNELSKIARRLREIVDIIEAE